MRTYWIKPGEDIEVKGNVDPTLQEMQDFVGGDIEHVSVLFKPPGATEYIRASMIVNEDRRIHDLPFNDRATDIYHNNIREVCQDQGRPYHRDQYPDIVGNVIVFNGVMS